MDKIKELYIKYREIIPYLIMGGFTTIVNWGAYAICTFVLPIPKETTLIFISNIIAWVIAVLFAYVTNKKWVFESRTDNLRSLAKEFFAFVGARVFTGALEIAGVPLLVMIGLSQTLFGVEGFLAKILISVIVVILNYIFSKLFIFKKKQD